MTNTVLVNKEDLQKLLDFIVENEWRDFDKCQSMGWSDEELENHHFSIAQSLQHCINDQ